ncbi:flagellar basal body rod protein FlgC [Pelagibius litoralis]|uniref:Flagellar basal-body rod protein FlgC n=1 Tax=Pelagibius litoralis TaxID=374515 RepID=A0A967KC16_9PROT|nr:flagellar basal body rod protein FlgC [Pelagibius litoralis]NIA69435.1 flagellar basal body rod protein FlgC [Pelagibius litoralis]
MDLDKSLNISAAGMRSQGTRLRVIAENIANAGSTAQTPGGEPYRRKLVTFENVLDHAIGVETVRVDSIVADRGAFGRRFEPGHPAADEDGYVLTPNVNSLMEMSDMREAQRSYEANLKVIESSRAMLQKTIDILR